MAQWNVLETEHGFTDVFAFWVSSFGFRLSYLVLMFSLNNDLTDIELFYFIFTFELEHITHLHNDFALYKEKQSNHKSRQLNTLN